MNNEDFEDIERKIRRYNQEHLLDYYNSLEEGELKEKFEKQLEKIDFELIDSLYKNTAKVKKDEEVTVEPINYWDKERLGGKYDFYEEIGIDAIKQGKLAAVTMAGGQGTRLGHDGPKGTYDIGLDSHKSLFELLCDGLKEAEKKYGVTIPWFIMTSEENNKQTIEFFEKNKNFGYGNHIYFFVQGQLPMVDTEGKILIGENGLIKEAADGHGGVYESLVKSGMVDKMKELGIEWVFIAGVDNYAAGELLYGESHILCNLFNISAIERMGNTPLPYHSAFKKATYIDLDGNKIVPDAPNAFKFEAFLFDAFEDLDDMVVLRVKREEEFAPVKNATGVDSPETARELYNKFHKLT